MIEPNVEQLLADRGVTVPEEDLGPVEEHWKKMRRLRGEVDEALLADHEIAVTWTAVQGGSA
jgi:methyl coenzyme M reductase subunit C-like uncharacterized protein (methanogenesis marker protein 7)